MKIGQTWFYKTMAKWHSAKVGGRIGFGKVKIKVPLSCLGSRGTIVIGDKASFGDKYAPKCADGRIMLQAREKGSIIRIGRNASFSNNITLVACSSIRIGDDFLCGDGVRIMDSDFHNVDPATRRNGKGRCCPVNIGNNVWLGSGVIVLKGVEIGDGCVVAAGSVVTQNIPFSCLAAGVPARVIKENLGGKG